jgi:hypothetical protein
MDNSSFVALDGGGKPRLVIEPAELNGKNAGRKVDREFIARALVALAEARGAEVERRDTTPTTGYCGAGIDLRFKLGGVGATVSIDNLHGGEWSLVSWYNTVYPSRDFNPRFCACVGEPATGRPHHKATSCPADWYSLAMMLDAGLCLAASDGAFIA